MSKIPAMASDSIVESARRRLEETLRLSSQNLPSHTQRWAAYSEMIRSGISSISTCRDVLHFAQTKVGFEHRGSIHHEGKFTALYERELKDEFPNFAESIDKFADIDDSAEDTSYIHLGRPVSNVLFYLARIILSCLTHLPKAPHSILEIGGGYGAPGRLWMNNPIHHPARYFILDVPESLFFCDVVLRSEFGEDAVHYIKAADDLHSLLGNRTKFFLCPLPLYQQLADLTFDLVINTGSLQEMGESWVDFYHGFLDQLNARWFYSLNYFGQPLDRLWESGNLYSPRLSSRWRARLLRWNPAFIRMQADRNYLEAIYEKDSDCDQSSPDDLIRFFNTRIPSGEIFAEIMDLARRNPSNDNRRSALDYALRLPTTPKEALWLAEQLRHTSDINNIDAIEDVLIRLRTIREGGVEEYY